MACRVIAYSFFLFAELICFHGTILFPGLFSISQELGIALMTMSLLSKMAGYFCSSFVSTVRNFNLAHVTQVGVVLFVAGVLSMFFLSGTQASSHINFLVIVTIIASGLFIGVGDALINMMWGQQCTALPLRRAYLFILGCHSLSTLLYTVTFFISDLAQISAVILCLIAMSVLLFRAPKTPAAQFDINGLSQAFGELWRPIFGTSVFCFLTGLLPWMSGQYDSSIADMRLFSLISTIIVLAALAIPAVLVKHPLRLENIYKFVLSLVATAFLLLPIVWDGYGGVVNAFSGAATYAAGIVLWCLTVDATRRYHLNAATTFGLSLGITTGASALGRALGYFGGRSLSQGDVSVTVVSLISLYLLSMIALVIFKPKKGEPISDEGFKEKPKEVAPSTTLVDQRQTTYHEISEEYKLSARETEVFGHLAQGHSMVEIAKDLQISENTARTYIKRIYQKMEIHSKQDIIDMCRRRF